MNPLTELLRREIQAAGAISFARFMEVALYHPEHGYYERAAKQIGRCGDFYTNVSVGSIFGELLAFQIAEWLETATGPAHQVIEAGAHNALLALDMLRYWQAFRPCLFERLEYWLIEPSPRRRVWQQNTLETFSQKVRWISAVGALGKRRVCGVILSNEFLDALPVRRMVWSKASQCWREMGVGWEHNRFVWTPIPLQQERAVAVPSEMTPEVSPALPPDLLTVLPDGFILDFCPAARKWWERAARTLAVGCLLTIDYGLPEEQLLAPHRPAGTLRAYRRHRLSDDLLAWPGEQDLTAHVDLTALQVAGESAGLHTTCLSSQTAFLTRIGQAIHDKPSLFPSWTARRVRQFKQLVHPEQLGDSFKVIVQSRLADKPRRQSDS